MPGVDTLSRFKRGIVLGTVAGAAAFVVAEAFRPRGGPARLLDWDEIAELARRRLGAERLAPAARRKLATQYARLAGDVRPALLEAVGGLPRGTVLPDFQALDRPQWLDLNLGILSRALAPLEEIRQVPSSLLTDWGRAGIDRWVAALLGFLAGRVLGQFDPQLLGREPVVPGLYLVEPNVAAFQRKDDLPGDDLRRWLILHELTHAWQFAAHPWLREHLNGELERLVKLAIGDGRRGFDRLAALTLGVPGQLEGMRRIQALMTVVEGYSNLVMNLVGRDLLPGFDQLEDAHRRRSSQRSPLELIVWRLTGLEAKMRQYRVGEAFSRAVFDSHGMAVLNRVWESAESMPRPDELRDPGRWVRRVGSLPAGRGIEPRPRPLSLGSPPRRSPR